MMNSNVLLLCQRVWGVADTILDRQWKKRSLPYQQHYQDVLAASLVDGLRAEQFSEVVDTVRRDDISKLSTATIVSHLQAQHFPWLQIPHDDETLVHVLELAVRLWLFTSVDLCDFQGTLSDAVSGELINSLDSQPQDDLIRLSDDFSAKNLEKRGGFTIHWTSDLTEHLTCVNGKVIKVFRHGSVLQSYRDRTDGVERSLYPQDILSELDDTFYLLFPYEGIKAAKRMWKESKRRQVDLIEAGWADDAIGEFVRLQLKSYPRYGNRLAEIQRRYDASKPVHPKQWWYDRRRRAEWATLMIAVLVLILTVITVVTSIMQVYAAFR